MLFSAGALAHPLLAAAAFALSAAAVLVRRGRAPGATTRLGLSAPLALVLAAPGLVPLARALSLPEALAILTTWRPRELPPLALGLLLGAFAPLAFARAAEHPSRAARAAFTAVDGLAALLLVARVHGWFGSGQLDAQALAALTRASQVAAPLESVCAADGERDFVPALAGRRAGEPGPWIPTVYADEWARREPRACDRSLETFLQRP
jgi:hypothetical protein